MTETKPVPRPFLLSPDRLSDEVSAAVLTGAAVAEPAVEVIGVVGPGVVACLQGILTNDVEAAGDGGFLYGAVLTPKGMIICDMWVARDGGTVHLTVPAHGAGGLTEVFQRYFPPRLARVSDRSADLGVVRLVGPEAAAVAERASVAVPDPGRAANALVGDAACLVARPTDAADFALQIQVSRDHLPDITRRLVGAGAAPAGVEALEFSRILAGWPRLGAEIDARTLPQEVRYDEIDGVSYTKGCYTGQETVARLHFRGHANRSLLGLVWEDEPDPAVSSIAQDDKPRGRVCSIAWFPPLEQHIGLGIVRREVDRAREIMAADALAGVVRLPFDLAR